MTQAQIIIIIRKAELSAYRNGSSKRLGAARAA